MGPQITCAKCQLQINADSTTCPHCASPSLYPNVTAVSGAAERAALQARYELQVQRAEEQNRKDLLNTFESLAKSTRACISMPRWEIDRLVSKAGAVAATYFQQIEGNSRVPDNDEWDRLRRIADGAFFQSYGKAVHFAALSSHDRWLWHYGDGAIFFKDEMIEHRATVFEENTARWVRNCAGSFEIPPGSRATWADRHLLTVAKLGAEVLSADVNQDELILHNGMDSAHDSFLEVHILLGYSIQSVDAVIIKEDALSPLTRQALIHQSSVGHFTYDVIP